MKFHNVHSKNKISVYIKPTVIIALLWVLFQLLFTSRILIIDFMQLKHIHLLFALIFVFVAIPIARENVGRVGKSIGRVFDYILVLLALLSGIWIVLVYPDRIMLRTVFVDPFYKTDLVLGITTIILSLEATRRAVALPIVFVILTFIAYIFLGPIIPGKFGHSGFSVPDFVEFIYFTGQGLYGIPLYVSALYVFLFLFFAAILKQTGAADFFPKLALAIAGHTTGGVAKAAVIGSSLMGMIQGTGSGNVAATGSITIPLMKKSGFKSDVAAAIESVASTGGQIIPPVMGAAAFIMAELANIPYRNIIIIAIIPAILYYFAVFTCVHFEAVKSDIRGMKKSELPKLSDTLKEGWQFIIPLLVLVFLVFIFTLEKAVFYTIIFTIVVSYFKKRTMLTPKSVIDAIEETGFMAIKVAPICAVAGIIIGVTEYTNLGLNFSSVLLSLGGENLLLLLIISALGCYILGMGMPTSAAYITVAAVAIPVLVKVGVEPIVAHFFAFYYACVALFTPPIATAAFVAAGIAGAYPMRTAGLAAKIGIGALIVPFIFAFRPELLIVGPPWKILITFIFSALGLVSLSCSLSGYTFRGKSGIFNCIVLVICSLLMFYPHYLVNIIGALLSIFLLKMLPKKLIRNLCLILRLNRLKSF